MTSSRTEALAGLKLLVLVARSVGSIGDDEQWALVEALRAADVSADVTIEALVDGDYDAERLALEVISPGARDAILTACLTMASAREGCGAAQLQVVDRVAAAWAVSPERRSLIERVVREVHETRWFSRVESSADPGLRRREVLDDIVRYASFTAVLGGNPVPIVSIATDVAVVGLQAKLFVGIGRHWGRPATRDVAMRVMARLGISAAARLAVIGLPKFAPISGSSPAAMLDFSSTWAVGLVADAYWSSDGDVEVGELEEIFHASLGVGRSEWAARRLAIDASRAARSATLDRLAADYVAGGMTLREYEVRVAGLV